MLRHKKSPAGRRSGFGPRPFRRGLTFGPNVVDILAMAEVQSRILIIDDEPGIRLSLRGILEEDEGHQVSEAESAEQGLEMLSREVPDVVFLDIWLPGMDGLEALLQIREAYPSLPVIMISGHGTIESAVTAIREGAHDFIEKPLSLERVVLAVNRALEVASLRRENLVLKSGLAPSFREISGNSPAVKAIKEQIAQVAPTDAWVLIDGENGTGKEVAARTLHSQSKRRDKPMVAVNCAAIPEELIESELFGHEKGAFTGAEASRPGRFEMAHQGTLFLDEIADMSLKTQAKILRLLQEQKFERVGGSRTIKVDVRVIAATNKNLEEEIAAGRFREDLYYRLKVFPITVPPLRERGEDILLLAGAFQSAFAQEHGFRPLQFTPEAEACLLAYAWPGNVRELRNFVERMLIIHAGQTIDAGQLPPEMRRDGKGPAQTLRCSGLPAEILAVDSFREARQQFETAYLEHKYRELNGNISRLAEHIGLERSHLSRKLKACGISQE